MWGNRMSDQTPRAGLPLVLLAGDHPDDTNWLRNLLEPAGYAVLREPSGRYALDRARAEGLLDPITGLYNRQGLARRARELGSQAFREHGALACVVIALDVEATATASEGAGHVVVRCVHALKSSARLSDVVGRLSPTEFAVLAPGTDAAGARRLAERLASTVQASAGGMPTPAADPGAQPLAQLRVRCGYEAVANVGYAPIEPVDLLVRASTALRTGRAEGGSWLRRFDDGASTTPTP